MESPSWIAISGVTLFLVLAISMMFEVLFDGDVMLMVAGGLWTVDDGGWKV